LFWSIWSERKERRLTVSFLSLFGTLVFLALDPVWSGTFAKQLIWNQTHWFDGFMAKRIFGQAFHFQENGVNAAWVWGYIVAILTTGGLTYMIKPGKPVGAGKSRVLDWVRSGYGVERTLYSWVKRPAEVLVRFDEWVRVGLLENSLGQSSFDSFKLASLWITHHSDGIEESLSKRLSVGTGVLSKALQVLQNGNVQWYVFFALSSGLAIMIHFFRFSN